MLSKQSPTYENIELQLWEVYILILCKSYANHQNPLPSVKIEKEKNECELAGEEEEIVRGWLTCACLLSPATAASMPRLSPTGDCRTRGRSHACLVWETKEQPQFFSLREHDEDDNNVLIQRGVWPRRHRNIVGGHGIIDHTSLEPDPVSCWRQGTTRHGTAWHCSIAITIWEGELLCGVIVL
jgi:hypothetical protein